MKITNHWISCSIRRTRDIEDNLTLMQQLGQVGGN